MKTLIAFYLFLLLSITVASCSHPDKHREEGKIFHAGPSSGGIGGLYFGLYDDNTYQVCSSGGIGQYCYSGNFSLNADTLTLNKLNKEIPLSSNRLILMRYADQDSTYWKWKYEKSMGVSTWQDFKRSDAAMGGTGDVYQLGDKNEIMRDELHFIIRLDSLRNHH